jgi:glucose/arabinose dehydrogenase
MLKYRRWFIWFTVLALVAAVVPFGATALAAPTAQEPPPQPSANVSVFATGLDNPRGLTFGPDGMLYVAEGGQGGTDSTEGQCDQVVVPVGPYTGSSTGARISKIAADGTRTTVVDNLPSSQTSEALGGEISGVGAVAFLGDTLYAVLAGAGCSHGVADVPNALIKANADGTWEIVADLSAYLAANPVARPEEDDFEPDGGWYSLAADGDNLVAIEPNHGELDKLTTDGTVSRIVDISASQGHVVPTALAVGPDGDFYVGNLDEFPVTHGHSHIYKIAPDGAISVYASGLTAVLGLAFGPQGELYALEMSDTATSPDGLPVVPGSGRVVRVMPDGYLEEIATHLMLPTAMTMGPDGMLYVSNCGFGCPAGAGEIVRIAIPQRVHGTVGDLSYGVAGMTTMNSPTEGTSYGFLTGINGMPDDFIFSGSPQGASTAQFTFSTVVTATKSIDMGDLQIGEFSGTTTVYYNPSGGDLTAPDSFKQGTPVATFDVWQRIVMDMASSTMQGVDRNTVTEAQPFQVDGEWYQLVQPGDLFRDSFSGHGDAQNGFVVAGTGVSLGTMTP